MLVSLIDFLRLIIKLLIIPGVLNNYFIRKIIEYSTSTMNVCLSLSHELWVSLIKFNQ